MCVFQRYYFLSHFDYVDVNTLHFLGNVNMKKKKSPLEKKMNEKSLTACFCVAIEIDIKLWKYVWFGQIKWISFLLYIVSNLFWSENIYSIHRNI